MLPSNDLHLANTRNVARFFVENRAVGWVLLVATMAWGVWSYERMPKRKDPETPILTAAAICRWPGASADRIELLVTSKIEERISESASVRRIESISRGSVSVVYVVLDDRVTDTARAFDDVKMRLDGIRDLPSGAGPVEFIKDFGDTAALMLTVASPRTGAADLERLARALAPRMATVRAQASSAASRATVVTGFPNSVDPRLATRQRDLLAGLALRSGVATDIARFEGPGFAAFDARFSATGRDGIGAAIDRLVREQPHAVEAHPDIWRPAVIVDAADAAQALEAVVGDRYSYRALDEATDLVRRTLQGVPQVSKVARSGLLAERIYLDYSQERLASFGVQARLSDILNARNTTLPGGLFEAGDRSISLDPSGEFETAAQIGDVIMGSSPAGVPLYLRDGVDIVRGYESPPRFLNFYSVRDATGWHRSRAITLAIQMRPGEQIGAFGRAVDAALASLAPRLPADLVMARTSDQPLQVTENVESFMTTLYEALVLVVLVAFVGFWEWRAALLMAASIPLTLAMTFGGMSLLGVDVQQVSLVALIISLGLLVDDPVVAGDAIAGELDRGVPRVTAAWLGPTRLAQAILFATIANIVAYLPLLLVEGSVGRFIYSLPVVLTCALVASRIVSMTFIPLLGYHLLRPARAVPDGQDARASRLKEGYRRLCGWTIDHRWVVLAASLVALAAGAAAASRLKTQFFPTDVSYLSYADVWLPEDATFSATNAAADAAAATIRRVADEYGKANPGPDGQAKVVLDSLTTFVGGGGPRFWFSVAPELQQLNYAQIIIKVRDSYDTVRLAAPLQRALSAAAAGARIDVRQLETSKPIGVPIAVRVSGEDIPTLRALAERTKAILRSVPLADRVRDDWGADSFVMALEVDPDRANFAGVSNQEVALSSAAALGGYTVTVLREGDKQIPVALRLRADERAEIGDLQNLYVHSMQSPLKVPLSQVASFSYRMTTEKIRRRNHFRTITVGAFPVAGALPSEVVRAARPRLAELARQLPPGYRLEIGGEAEEQARGFSNLAVVMLTSIAAIFLALVFQFRSAVKPLLVFAAVPYGLVGGLLGLVVTRSAFGFMAFLGIASLVGVIVSHIIVKFDVIEAMRHQGWSLRQALVDAGANRLRPVLITLAATAFGLVPLAIRGGPVWKPLCYAQMGGLAVATVVTLLLVPVLYAIAVLDLKIVDWPAQPTHAPDDGATEP